MCVFFCRYVVGGSSHDKETSGTRCFYLDEPRANLRIVTPRQRPLIRSDSSMASRTLDGWWLWVVTVEIPLKGSDPDQRISRDRDQWEGWMNLNDYAEWCFLGPPKLPGHWGSMILKVLDFIPLNSIFCINTTSLKTLGWWNYMCFFC